MFTRVAGLPLIVWILIGVPFVFLVCVATVTDVISRGPVEPMEVARDVPAPPVLPGAASPTPPPVGLRTWRRHVGLQTLDIAVMR